MRGRVVVVAWLALVWVALWGEPSLPNLVVGLAVGTLLALRYPVRDFPPVVRPLAVARLGVVFAADLLVSSLEVAGQVLSPRPRLREGIVAVPIHCPTRVLGMLVANMVSLTPGTLTVDVAGDGRTLYIHVLRLDDPEEVRASVQALERRAVAAFGTREAVAAVRRPPARGGEG